MARDWTILYVADPEASRRFYRLVFAAEPTLDVPGMTTFRLPGGSELGLMPEQGIKDLLGPALPDPSPGRGIPRVEIYLTVEDDPADWFTRALEAGATEVSPLLPRTWGDRAAYVMDADGHVLVFAAPLGE